MQSLHLILPVPGPEGKSRTERVEHTKGSLNIPRYDELMPHVVETKISWPKSPAHKPRVLATNSNVEISMWRYYTMCVGWVVCFG